MKVCMKEGVLVVMRMIQDHSHPVLFIMGPLLGSRQSAGAAGDIYATGLSSDSERESQAV